MTSNYRLPENDLDEWCRSQRRLLKMEHDEEVEVITTQLTSMSAKECETAGISVLSLMVASTSTGLRGRVRVTLQKLHGGPLPATSIKVGDEVRVSSPGYRTHMQTLLKNASSSSSIDRRMRETAEGIRGVVSKVTSANIDILIEADDAEEMPEMTSPVRLDLVSNDATYVKLCNAINLLERVDREGGPSQRLVRCLFQGQPLRVAADDSTVATPELSSSLEEGSISGRSSKMAASASSSRSGAGAALSKHSSIVSWFNSGLNAVQRQAVSLALKSDDLFLIHGPPGTGTSSRVVAKAPLFAPMMNHINAHAIHA